MAQAVLFNKLATSAVFSTLDLQCGYWQMPVNPQDHPGPGMSLFQFRCT